MKPNKIKQNQKTKSKNKIKKQNQKMRIISWNVAGLRAKIKKNEIYNIIELNPDIICIQETKADENQVKIPEDINKIYTFRYWSENKGITQKKGFSGTSIWLKEEPIQIINLQEEFDQEGRIGIIELEEYYLINVYVVNSQEINSERCKYRNLRIVKLSNHFLRYQYLKNQFFFL